MRVKRNDRTIEELIVDRKAWYHTERTMGYPGIFKKA